MRTVQQVEQDFTVAASNEVTIFAPFPYCFPKESDEKHSLCLFCSLFYMWCKSPPLTLENFWDFVLFFFFFLFLFLSFCCCWWWCFSFFSSLVSFHLFFLFLFSFFFLSCQAVEYQVIQKVRSKRVGIMMQIWGQKGGDNLWPFSVD